MKYLDEFLNNKSVRQNPDSKYAISHDKWDKRKASDIAAELVDFQQASNELYKVAKTGHEALRDTLLALFKVSPQLRDPKEVRPSFLINHRIEQEMMELPEYQKLHGTTRGDSVAAGLACVDLEPELEVLFDKLQEQQKQSEALEDMLGEAGDLADDLDEMMAAAAAAAAAGEEEEAKNYQDQMEAIQEQLEALRKQIEEGTSELEDGLDKAQPEMKAALKEAMSDAQSNAEALASFDSWSLQPGALKKMNPQARIALSKKLQTPKFKRMAEIIGRMQSMALAEQINKTNWAQEEIFDVTLGSDLTKMIPNEIIAMSDDDLVWDWMHRWIEGNLQEYALRGTETVQRGGIVSAEDGSGSMNGEREIWAKAINLALLKIATMQHRSFTCIHFGGVGQYILFEFDTSGNELKLKMTYGKQVKEYSGVEAVIEFADKSMSSGTDFVTPMSVAIDCMQKEFDEKGVTESDFIFLTDGECGVPPQFLEDFKKKQAELDFKVYGVAVCTNPKSEPLNTICDGQVASVQEIADLSNMKPIFGSI